MCHEMNFENVFHIKHWSEVEFVLLSIVWNSRAQFWIEAEAFVQSLLNKAENYLE